MILNNTLPWDHTHLGRGSIVSTHVFERTKYTVVSINNDTVYGILYQHKDFTPFIVEDLKDLFHVYRRGFHQVRIGNRECLLYRVLVDANGEIVHNTTLNSLLSTHPLRGDKKFRLDVQKALIFSDILSLTNIGEKSLALRPSPNELVPIVNNIQTTFLAVDKSEVTISDRLFARWFGEEISPKDIIQEMLGPEECKDVPLLIASLRSQIDDIVRKHDRNYIWYSHFILDKISKYLE
jgi:gamma-glutamylcyclotransferase (GGCT)/AIG2-like uncharacterized protein YtfP